MAGAREGSRLARALCQGKPSLRMAQTRARRFASSAGEASTPADLADLENTTAFTAPAPDAETTEAFKAAQSKASELKLPGSR